MSESRPKSAFPRVPGEDVTKRSGFNYTDIVRDIAITDENDALALGLNEKHRAALSRSSRFNIESIRRIAGDGSLSYFTGASDSIRCAILLKEEFAKEPSGPVTIGIHNGEIYCTLNTAQLN